MSVPVVMRAHNDMPLVRETLAMVAEQTVTPQLLVMDNASSDGTREAAEPYAARIIDVPAGQYVPGRVLNRAMEETEGDVVVFLNSDCTPVDARWLERLLDAMKDEGVAAAFGRQDPRPDCDTLHAKDTVDTYGDGARQQYWRHCFSMASSAIRRSVWEEQPFDESLGYSEDIDWTWRARRAGHEIRYAPDSIVLHSHNYTLGQLWRRHEGEGRAEAHIFDWQPWERSLLRYSVLPYARQVLSDVAHCAREHDWLAMLRSPVVRLSATLGRRRGFVRGEHERSRARTAERSPEHVS